MITPGRFRREPVGGIPKGGDKAVKKSEAAGSKRRKIEQAAKDRRTLRSWTG